MKRDFSKQIKQIAQNKLTRVDSKELGNRLYEKGFTINTMPSVKRYINNQKQNSLAITFTSFQNRNKKLKPMIIKKQSTVFPTNSLDFQQKNLKNQTKQNRNNKQQQQLKFTGSKLKMRTANNFFSPPINFRIQSPQSSSNKARLEKKYLKQQKSNVFDSTSNERLEFRMEQENQQQLIKKKKFIDKFTGGCNTDKKYIDNKKKQETKRSDEIDELKINYHNKQNNINLRQQTQLDQYIKLIQKKVMNVDEFLYLRRQECDPLTYQSLDPYDLKVVDYQIIKNQQENNSNTTKVRQYFTISKKGLCHYINNKPVQFILLNEWLQQRQIYDKIKNLKFFNKFRKWKTVKMWKRNVIKHKIQICSKILQQKLFLLNPQFRNTLLSIKKNSIDMSREVSFLTLKQNQLHTNSQITFNLQTFKNIQERKRRDVVKDIQEFSKINKSIVSKGFDKCLENLHVEQKNQQNSDDLIGKKGHSTLKGNRRETAYQILGFGVKMSYQQRSQLRKECSKFVRFSYLIDFIFLQSLSQIYNKSVDDFTIKLQQMASNQVIHIVEQMHSRTSLMSAQSQCLLKIKLQPNFRPIKQNEYVLQDIQPYEFNENIQEKGKNFLMLYHLNVKPNYEDDYVAPVKKRRIIPKISSIWLRLKPSCEEIVSEINNCIRQGLNSLKHFQRWSKHYDMQKYVNVLQQWDDIVCQSWQVAQQQYLDPTPLLQSYPNDNKLLRIKNLIGSGFQKLHKYIENKFSEFLQIYYQNQNLDFQLYSDPNLLNLSQSFQYSLCALQIQKELFQRKIPVSTQIGLFKLESSEVKNKMIPNPNNLYQKLKQLLPQLVVKRTAEAKKWLLQQSNKLKINATHIDQYVQQVTNLKQIQNSFPIKKRQIDDLARLYQIMSSFKMDLKDRKTFEVQTIQAKDLLQQTIISAQDNSNRQAERFGKLVCKTLIPQLEKQINKLSEKILNEKFLRLDQNQNTILKELKQIQQKFRDLQAKKQKYIIYQRTLNIQQNDFSHFNKVNQQIQARITLWQSLCQWAELQNSWIDLKFNQIKIEQILQQVKQYKQIIKQVKKVLSDNVVLNLIEERVSKFDDNVPVIIALRSNYLVQQHWNQIRKSTNIELKLNQNLNFQQFLSLGVDKYKDQIQNIALTAKKEYETQKQFQQTELKWKQLILKSYLYKSKGKSNKQTYLFTDLEQTNKIIDKLVTEILEINNNKYSRTVRNKSIILKQTLKYSQMCFEQWIKLQELWYFLDVFFNSNQNKKIHENTLFQNVDKAYKVIMKGANKNRYAHKILMNSANSLQKLKQMRSNLNKVYGGLQDFLNQKRKGFHRFYFIQNQQLLNIICNINNQELEKLIKKCFPGISKVIFEGDRINSLKTVDGQILKKSTFSTIGQIDQIFNIIQEVVVEGVRKLMKLCKNPEDNKKKWINSNHTQCLLAISKIEFCLYTEISIINQYYNSSSLTQYFEVFASDLKSFIISSLDQKDPNFQSKLRTIIAQDIMHRDIISDMINKHINTPNDFLWQKQIRFYWQENLITSADQMGIIIKQLLFSTKYGSEYIKGNQRIIWTSSTDKLSLSIFSSLKFGNNIMIQGNKKVETITNLGYYMGYNTLCYGCSPQSSFQSLQKFLTGIYNVGNWGIIQNIHLLNEQVMRMAAISLRNISDLLIKNEKKKQIEQKYHFGFFITVNKYSQQTIPITIKGLYRIVNFNLPNLVERLCIKLSYLNFTNYLSLSKKIGKVVQIISLYLPEYAKDQQKLLKQFNNLGKQQEIQQTLAVYNLLNHYYNRQLDQSTYNIVIDILADIFDIQKIVLQHVNPITITDSNIDIVLNKLQLFRIQKLQQKLQEINIGLFNKQSIIITGESSCKTTLIRILSVINEAQLYEVNLDITKPELLFGKKQSQSLLSNEGLIMKILKQNKQKLNYLLIQGNNQSSIQLLNYAIQNSKLFYKNGQKTILPNNIRYIFQNHTLQQLDMTLISNSIIFTIKWSSTYMLNYFTHWANQKLDNNLKEVFFKYIDHHFFPIVNAIKQYIQMTELHILTSFCNLLNGFFPIKQKKYLKSVIAFCLIWSVFNNIKSEYQAKVDILFKKHFQLIPSTDSVYDYYLDETTNTFKNWNNLVQNYKIQDFFVRTTQNIKYKYLFERLLKVEKSLILIKGPADSCKSMILKQYYYSNNINISCHRFSFLKQRKIQCFQSEILSKLDTFRKKLITSKSGIEETRILIDDINLESSTIHHNLKLINNIYQKQGLFDLNTLIWKHISTVRFALSARILNHSIIRHTNQFNVCYSEKEFITIFECILNHELVKEDLKKNISSIVNSTFSIYKKLKNKFQGLYQISDIKDILQRFSRNIILKESDQMKKYWQFATLVGFGDRLEDKQYLSQLILQQGIIKQQNHQILTYSSIFRNNNKEEQLKDKKRKIGMTNQRVQQYNKKRTPHCFLQYVVLEDTFEHIIKLYRTLDYKNIILNGKKNTGRIDILKIVAEIKGYTLKYFDQKNVVDQLFNLYNQYKDKQNNHVIALFQIHDNQTLFNQFCKIFEGQIDEVLGIELRIEQMLKNEKFMKLCVDQNVQNIVQFFKTQILKNIHIVVLLSDKKLLDQVIENRSYIINNFAIQHFNEFTRENLELIGQVHLKDEQLSEPEIEKFKQVNKIAAQMHLLIKQVAQDFTSIKQFTNFVKLFSELYKDIKLDVQTYKEMYYQSYEKSKFYKQQNKILENKIEELREKHKNISIQINHENQKLRSQQTQELQSAFQLLTSNNKQIESLQDRLIQLLEKRASEIKKAVMLIQNVQEQKLRTFKNTLVPGTNIIFIIQCIMILLGKSTQIKQIKQQISNIKQFIKSLKNINLKTISKQALKRYKEYIKKEEINFENLKKCLLGNQFGALFTTLKNYLIEKQKYIEINKQIKTKQQQNLTIKEKYPELEKIIIETESKKLKLFSLNQNKLEIERSLLELSNKRTNQEKLLQIVANQLQNWNEQYLHYKIREQNITNDLLLLSAYLTYFPQMRLSQRKNMINKIQKRINIHLKIDFYQQLSIEKYNLQNIEIQQLVFENMMIINNSIKPVLMIDLDHKGTQWLKLVSKQVKIVNQDQFDFMNILEESSKMGGHLVVEVNKFLSPFLQNFIQDIQQQQAVVKIKEHQVTINQFFKLYIVIRSNIELKKQIIDKFTVVKYEYSDKELIEQKITTQYLKKYNLEYLLKQPQIMKRISRLKNEQSEYKKQLIKIYFESSKSNNVSESALKDLENLQAKIQQISCQIKQQQSYINALQTYPDLSTYIKYAIILYDTLTKLIQLDYSFKISIKDYLNLITNIIQQNQITNEKSFLIYLYSCFQKSVSIDIKRYFAFILALQIQDINQQCLNSLLSNSEEQIIKYMQQKNQYKQLRINLIKDQEKWKNLIKESNYFKNIEINGFKLTNIEKLICARIIKPRNQYQFYLKFIEAVLGPQYLLIKSTNYQTKNEENKNKILVIQKADSARFEDYYSKFSSIVKIKKLEQLEQFNKKNSLQKSVLLIDEMNFIAMQQNLVENQTIKNNIVVITHKSRNRNKELEKYQKIHIPYIKTFENQIDEYLQTFQLKNKYSSNLNWYFLYFYKCTQRYFKFKKQSQIEPIKLANGKEMLNIISNLSQQTTNMSKNLLKEQTDFDELLQQRLIFIYVVPYLFNCPLSQSESLFLARLMDKIIEQRQYILQRNIVIKKLSKSSIDQILNITQQEEILEQKNMSKRFLESIRKIYKFKQPSNYEKINIERLIQKINKIQIKNQKYQNIAYQKLINESIKKIYTYLINIKLKLINIKQIGCTNTEFQSLFTALIKINKIVQNKNLNDIIENLIQKIQALENFKLDSPIYLGAFENVNKFLDIYLRQYSKNNQIPYQNLVFVIKISENQSKQNQDNLILKNFYFRNTQWDKKLRIFTDSYPTQMNSMVELIPQTIQSLNDNYYKCPVYVDGSQYECSFYVYLPIQNKKEALQFNFCRIYLKN